MKRQFSAPFICVGKANNKRVSGPSGNSEDGMHVYIVNEQTKYFITSISPAKLMDEGSAGILHCCFIVGAEGFIFFSPKPLSYKMPRQTGTPQ